MRSAGSLEWDTTDWRGTPSSRHSTAGAVSQSWRRCGNELPLGRLRLLDMLLLNRFEHGVPVEVDELDDELERLVPHLDSPLPDADVARHAAERGVVLYRCLQACPFLPCLILHSPTLLGPDRLQCLRELWRARLEHARLPAESPPEQDREPFTLRSFHVSNGFSKSLGLHSSDEFAQRGQRGAGRLEKLDQSLVAAERLEDLTQPLLDLLQQPVDGLP